MSPAIQRINPTALWSDITVFNQMAYFVEVPEGDLAADMRGQVQQVLEQAERSLSKVNSDKSRLLSATIYITDFANMMALNAAWKAWLPEGCAPSRACIKAELADPQYLVEIAFVAAI
ncbi:MAG: RidA family protein [Thiofilum sp.]|uniref:RidA family protein n=1 Tax=Thiofilum sp. TaxID=2212733 RepID=UPI0025EB7261|nr:RidA family protein [Thiofilum sp.]MBK8452130.1 RidA family protein [Thiofilum sp.]